MHTTERFTFKPTVPNLNTFQFPDSIIIIKHALIPFVGNRLLGKLKFVRDEHGGKTNFEFHKLSKPRSEHIIIIERMSTASYTFVDPFSDENATVDSTSGKSKTSLVHA